ncbi:unnamed protein product [Sympodiomycopsis kandeliae]
MPTLRKAKKQTREKATQHASSSSTEKPQSEHATITSAVAADPQLPPTLAAARLFPKPKAYKRGILRFKIKEQLEEGRGKSWNWHNGATHHGNIEPDDQELDAIRRQYGYKSEEDGGPSKLYMMILADALLPLPRYPMSGVVSPPLLATTGIVPCSIFSTGPDIIEHYCDCIIAAKREVILLTNYWQGGKNVNRIADALRELNKRIQQRIEKQDTTANNTDHPQSGTPAHKASPLSTVVVKIMWDRGPQTLADLFRCRKPVPPNMWKSNGLPTQEEVPNLNIEILNYHRPLMGTFHAKLLLVDRQVALINSNNIQDRPNVEACTRLEGDIVNSIYDHALISWGNALNPPLPCLSTPAPKDPSPSAFIQGDEGGNLPVMSQDKLLQLAREARKRLHQEDEETEEEKHKHAMMGSPSRRMSFADVVDGVMKYGGDKSTSGAGGTTSSSTGGGGLAGLPGLPRRKSAHDAESFARNNSNTTDEQHSRPARHAAATWASKVFHDRSASSAGATAESNHAPAAAAAPAAASSAVAGQSATADHPGYGFPNRPFASARDGTSTPPRTHFATSPSASTSVPASPSRDSSSQQTPGGKRHFADVVEAMMKKEGIKPALWAEGALDTLGLGPSSSRNVADEVRRSREQQRRQVGSAVQHNSPGAAANARAVSVPRAVAEEDRSAHHETEPSVTVVSDGDGETDGQATSNSSREDESPSSSQTRPAPPLLSVQGQEDSSNDEQPTVQTHGVIAPGATDSEGRTKEETVPVIGEPMSEKLSVPDANEGAPGSVGYRRQHHRTLSSLSKASASQRLAQITKSLDFANLSQVKGEIKADELSKFSSRAEGQQQKQSSAQKEETVLPTSDDAAPAPATAPAHDQRPSSAQTKTAAEPGEEAIALNEEEKAKMQKADSAILASEKQDEKAALAGQGQEGSDVLDFRAYLFHARHDPVPMALMNRRPHGTPGHSDIRNPQDAAWLAGFRYAKKHIFIQSPTLNASPIKAAVLAAVRRHVRVELWLDLGFNDKSESMPFQGGTNEQVVRKLYRQLRREGLGDEKYLEVYWYTGKDMTRPLNAVRKQRNCHVKYCSIDNQVAILGSGNQDTQSWFHSQEINICIDSKQIVQEWDSGLRRNQSTGIYGRVDDDGVWRGRSGDQVVDTGKE